MDLDTLIREAVKSAASDIFILAGFPASIKVKGELTSLNEEKLLPETTYQIIEQIYGLANRPMDKLNNTGDDDFSFAVAGVSRFRVSTYKQRGSLAAVIRIISFGIPDYREINIPDSVMEVAERTKGLVLVTGPAGGGKTTTLACIIDRINETRTGHIITLEEPIEYLHRNKKSVVSQREIELDSESYLKALSACLRQAPDVILVGEMRDFETIRTAMTAAETGHLVISTLHTLGAANSIDRIVDVFPPNQQQQIRIQLAMVLQSIVSQQLVPGIDGRMLPIFEVMHMTPAARTLVREAKTHQINALIASSAAEGMLSMDGSLYKLFKEGIIARETAVRYAITPDALEKRL